MDEKPDLHEPTLADVMMELRVLRAEVRALWERLGAGEGSAVSVAQAQQLLGCGRTRVYELLKARQLRAAPKVGRTRMITRASLEALLAVPEAIQARPGPARTQGRRQDLGDAIRKLRV